MDKKPTKQKPSNAKKTNCNNKHRSNSNINRVHPQRQNHNIHQNPYNDPFNFQFGMRPQGNNNHNQNNSNNNRIDPQRNPIGFLKDFFAGFGVEFPVREVLQRPPQNRARQTNQIPINRVQRHQFSDDIYDSSFDEYGAELNDIFRDNFSSNFRSNFERNVFEWLLSIIRGNQFEASQNKHPPTKMSVIKKLKKFDLSEKYCKKNDKGEMELPNCCICICDIKLKEKTVLLPCGHLLHWKCGFLWLRKNNTCPVCRFELPGERTPFQK